LFHHKTGTKKVAGGRVLTEHCPTCGKQTRLDEVETIEQAGVWFVDVVDDTTRGFKCRVCGDVFSLADAPAEQLGDGRERAQTASPRRRSAAETAALAERARSERVEAMAAEQRRRDADSAAKATRIEDELAELKKRMGR
jgi:hypothetical protein